jgi:hypothetical protein
MQQDPDKSAAGPLSPGVEPLPPNEPSPAYAPPQANYGGDGPHQGGQQMENVPASAIGPLNASPNTQGRDPPIKAHGRHSCTSYSFHPSPWHHLGDFAIVLGCLLMIVSTVSCYLIQPKYLVKLTLEDRIIRPLDRIGRGTNEPQKILIARSFHNGALILSAINFVFLLMAHNLVLRNGKHPERTCFGHVAIHARNLLKWVAFSACLCAFGAAGLLIDSCGSWPEPLRFR